MNDKSYLRTLKILDARSQVSLVRVNLFAIFNNLVFLYILLKNVLLH